MKLASGIGAHAAPVLLISPHLDDGVFACGCLLAMLARGGARRRVTVLTVFAARPPPGLHTEWDAAGGFASAREAVAVRRREDRRALTVLAARPRWLPFNDSQYGGSPSVARVARALRRLCRGARTVLFPLGLFHSDHRRVHEAVLRLIRARPPLSEKKSNGGIRWLAYEDALYRRLPGLRDEAVARLRRGGFRPRTLRFPANAEAWRRKSRAVACYASQLHALATPGRLGHGDTGEEEGYWQLQPRSCAIRSCLA